MANRNVACFYFAACSVLIQYNNSRRKINFVKLVPLAKSLQVLFSNTLFLRIRPTSSRRNH